MSVESELDEHAPPELSLKSPLVYVFFFFYFAADVFPEIRWRALLKI